MASPATTTTPPRRSLGSVYACAACNGEGVLDEGRYRELIETPGPLFLPVSQRPTVDGEGTPPYVLTVTSKNAKRERERERERERRRRQEAGVAEGNGDDGRDRAKRRKSAQQPDVANSPDDHHRTELEDDVGRADEGDDNRASDRADDQGDDQVVYRVDDQTSNQNDDQINDQADGRVDDQHGDRSNDNSDNRTDSRMDGRTDGRVDGNNDGTITPPPCSPPLQSAVPAQASPSPLREEEHPQSTCLSAPTSTPVEEIGTGSVRFDRADAEALLRLGLGKTEAASTIGEKILDVVFAVAGPASMEDILGFCHRWREGLIGQTRQDVDRKTSELRAEWAGRVPDGDQKSAIVAVHVSAYWALSDDTDDFVRSIVRRGRLADFYDAFDELLRPKTKPNPGWKKKHADVMKRRLAEAHPALDPDGEEYRRQKGRFKRQLHFGERWARLRREFGRGIFALLPGVMVTNRWIEQTLSTAQFNTWLNILKRHNRPDAEIVERVGKLVEEALGGTRPPTQLRLEGASPADVARDYRNPALLLPLEGAQCEDDLFNSDGAFLDEIHIT